MFDFSFTGFRISNMLIDPSGSFRRIICEQVLHHPPVSAFYADNEDFVFHGSIHPKLKFWGKSIEVHPKGVVTVELPKYVYLIIIIYIT